MIGCSTEIPTLYLNKDFRYYDNIINYFDNSNISYNVISENVTSKNYVEYKGQEYDINEFINFHIKEIDNTPKHELIKNIILYIIISIVFIFIIFWIIYKIKNKNKLDEWDDED